MHYIQRGTWRAAEQSCVGNGGHLWAINSYSKWWNIINVSGKQHFIQRKMIEINTLLITTTVLLFVGLRHTHTVCCNCNSRCADFDVYYIGLYVYLYICIYKSVFINKKKSFKNYPHLIHLTLNVLYIFFIINTQIFLLIMYIYFFHYLKKPCLSSHLNFIFAYLIRSGNGVTNLCFI